MTLNSLETGYEPRISSCLIQNCADTASSRLCPSRHAESGAQNSAHRQVEIVVMLDVSPVKSADSASMSNMTRSLCQGIDGAVAAKRSNLTAKKYAPNANARWYMQSFTLDLTDHTRTQRSAKTALRNAAVIGTPSRTLSGVNKTNNVGIGTESQQKSTTPFLLHRAASALSASNHQTGHYMSTTTIRAAPASTRAENVREGYSARRATTDSGTSKSKCPLSSAQAPI